VAKQEVAAAENAWIIYWVAADFSAEARISYFRLLLAKQEVSTATTAWQQLAQVIKRFSRIFPLVKT